MLPKPSNSRRPTTPTTSPWARRPNASTTTLLPATPAPSPRNPDGSTLPARPLAPPTPTTTISSSTNLVTVSAIDGLGHQVTSLVTCDPRRTIHVDTAYGGLGRAYTVSNPYRTGSDPTTSSGTTTYGYDAIGRKLTET